MTTSSNGSKLPKLRPTIKVIVLGCANVGKTSLMQRYVTGKYNEVRRPTIGTDFLSKVIVLNGTEIVIQIWDTAGQERFHQGTIAAPFYRGSNGAILMYDVNNEKSIEQIAQWRDELVSRKGSEIFFPIVVVGNKTDIRDKTDPSERVDQEPILTWCRENSYGHIETSVKDNYGVEAAMLAVVALAFESINQSSISSSNNTGNIDLDELYVPKKESFCSTCIN
eukprot:gene5168-7193_t